MMDATLNRRTLMTGTAALALGASLGFAAIPSTAAAADETPVKGGVLRLGMGGGSSIDTLDPRAMDDTIAINYMRQFYNGLVEMDQSGNLIGELAESWEPKPKATEWIFNIRKDIPFSSGKLLDAQDIVYSLNLHRGNSISGARDLLNAIKDIKVLSKHQISIELMESNVDLPAIFLDYHIVILPDGHTDFANPNGTGAFTLESFEPGVRVIAKAKNHYWKEGCGWFDAVDLRYIPNTATRTEALITGQVDAVNKLDPRTTDRVMQLPNVTVVRSKKTGDRYAFVADCSIPPYNDINVRRALKYGIDRQRIINTVFGGFASIGNDITLTPNTKLYDSSIPQHVYDPDKAAFYFKKSGLGSQTLELYSSDGAFSGAVAAAQLYQEDLRKAGINLQVKRVSGDGYWSNIWLKVPFCAVHWQVRPTIDAQLSQTFLSSANWNDTRWKNPEFDALIIAARSEMDEEKRRHLYSNAQRLIIEEGGMICFAIGDSLDGYGKKIRGIGPHPQNGLYDQRLPEKGWFGRTAA